MILKERWCKRKVKQSCSNACCTSKIQQVTRQQFSNHFQVLSRGFQEWQALGWFWAAFKWRWTHEETCSGFKLQAKVGSYYRGGNGRVLWSIHSFVGSHTIGWSIQTPGWNCVTRTTMFELDCQCCSLLQNIIAKISAVVLECPKEENIPTIC